MTREWYAVEAELEGVFDEDAGEMVLGELLQHPPGGAWGPAGRIRVTISIQATSLARAAARGSEILSQRHPLRCVRVLREQDRDDDLEDELLSVSQAAQALKISRASVVKRIDAGSLPASKIGNTYVIPARALDVTR